MRKLVRLEIDAHVALPPGGTLAERHEQVHLLFVSGARKNGAAHERRIHQDAKQQLANHVTFLGTRTNAASLYPDFQLVVHPSRSENLGGSIESLSAAVPIIATNVGGFPDVVISHQTGWLVPPQEIGRSYWRGALWSGKSQWIGVQRSRTLATNVRHEKDSRSDPRNLLVNLGRRGEKRGIANSFHLGSRSTESGVIVAIRIAPQH